VENAGLLAELRDRHRLLEELSKIQRSIARQQPFQAILDAITAGAADLLDDDMAGLRLRDSEDPDMLILHASTGVPADVARQVWRVPVSRAGVAGAALVRNDVVVMERYPSDPDRVPELATGGVASAMAAPVHDNGVVVGSLVVASSRPRVYTARDRTVLRHFADHVSLAVSDHQTRAKMQAAYHDFLTGLASRALFMERLQHAVAGARGQGWPAVLFVDLDRFKFVNDTLGHAAGDTLLAEVAERLRTCVAPDDVPARLGGDEFAVLLGDGRQETAVATAQRIISALRRPFVVSGREVFVNASVGISSGADGHTGEDLVRNADLAMYEAKKNGKGRYEVFRPDMQDRVMRTVGLEADLHRALERDELVLAYQPIVDLASGHVTAVEALVRWRHPERGLVMPGDFVPLAEDTGLIVPVGAWVLREACRQVVAWGPDTDLTVSVNLSARELQEPQLAAVVARTLRDTGLPPPRLVLEITESLLLSDTATSVAQLRRLKDLGVRLAIDDFGTGYSALAYLRQFPIDIIKIDRSFLGEIVTDPRAAALVQAIVQLGHTMGLTTVAEGVEGPEQVARLRRAGCGLGQGYHFGGPMDPATVQSLAARSACLPG
jgi:diguanylate cyclase (GGDEF)-like protein